MFRPAFEKLGGLRAFTNAPFMALTASANSDVQKLIQSSLHLHYPVVVSQSLDRPNVFFSVGEIKGYTVSVVQALHVDNLVFTLLVSISIALHSCCCSL